MSMESKKIMELRRRIPPTEKGCEIYAERPIICRLFGLKGGEGPLHCGKKDIFARNLFEITTSEIEKISKEYIKILLEYGTFGPFFRYE